MNNVILDPNLSIYDVSEILIQKIELAKNDLRREYNALFSANEKSLTVALAERDKAIDVASRAMDKRMDSINEFREQLSDQAARFITRPEHDVLISQITGTQVQLQVNSGKYILREELSPVIQSIEKLRETSSTSTGRSQILSQVVTGSIAGLAVLVSLVSFLYNNNHTSSTAIVPVPYSAQQADTMLSSRMDLLSNRLNALVSQSAQPTSPLVVIPPTK